MQVILTYKCSNVNRDTLFEIIVNSVTYLLLLHLLQ